MDNSEKESTWKKQFWKGTFVTRQTWKRKPLERNTDNTNLKKKKENTLNRTNLKKGKRKKKNEKGQIPFK